MSEYHHISVLPQEVITYLNLQPNGVYVDATFGGGGHTRALLQAEPTCRVIAFDWDNDALEINGPRIQEEFPGRVQLVWSNFARIGFHLKRLGVASVQGVFADFGTSQYQIVHKEGFSFERNAPLDMRMSSAHQKVTAAILVNEASEDELMHILSTYGGEKYARDIARAIGVERRKKTFRTTHDLASLIARIVPRGASRIHPATRTFQALRIVVNKELENIEAFLRQAPEVVASGGRLVCISFHSLEDRLVKHALLQRDMWRVITKQVVTPSEEECERNPSARSARLRAAERV